MKQLNKATMSLGMESIQFQDTIFFRQLADIIRPYSEDGIPTKTGREELSTALTKIIKHRFNLNVKFIWGDYYAMAAPDWNVNHILMTFFSGFSGAEDSHELMAKQKVHELAGTLDLAKARASGFYAEYEFTIMIDADWFRDPKYKAEHHAAVICHELGHVWTSCEMIDRAVLTNQILSRMQREFNNADPSKRTAIVKKASSELNVDVTDLVKSESLNKSEVVTTILLVKVVHEAKFNTKSIFYSLSATEQLADEFATRLGAGSHLIEALHISKTPGSELQKRSTIEHWLTEICKLVLVILIPVAWLSGAFLSAFFLLLISLLNSATDSSYTGGLYDTPKGRIQRVRNQIIEGMKGVTLTKEAYIERKKNLELVDRISNQYTERQQWLDAAWDYIFRYRQTQDRDFQQELEALAANSLYASAASLQHS